MADREKVVSHLNDCMEASRRDNTWVFVRKDIVEDAIVLLKEQDAKPPVHIHEEYPEHDWERKENGDMMILLMMETIIMALCARDVITLSVSIATRTDGIRNHA
jgi:hypothetical protein